MTRFSFHNVLFVSALLRCILIIYSEWHDARSLMKYTDVDYRVFSDAARFLLHPTIDNRARGPLNRVLGFNITLGDPYTRETYRYTPLLALILTPNEWLHPSFGKFLFAACDIVNGLRFLVKDQKEEKDSATSRAETLATIFSSVYLLNPLVFSISTRGSSESVLSLLVLLTLDFALRDKWNLAAIFLGISTHWKIYPVIYAASCLSEFNVTRIVMSMFSWRNVRFAAVSAGTFLLLGFGCYIVWGYPFVHESYIYHVHRLDHRHNFSPYFYLTYLTYPSIESVSLPNHQGIPWIGHLIHSPLASFVPQMSLALGTGIVFGRRKEDLVFAWFVQTVVFVLFNKVCTSQYFLWYLLFLPLLLPRLQSISIKRAFAYGIVWAGTQALWLAEAYKLEFLGENVFYGLWIRSLVYVAGNCWVLAGIMDHYS
ncbi:GPI mannosyltransferase 1 [Amanita rubescens]|nr:GPI mannosyltransferase 1 [Amanita rubescens]